MTKQKTSILIVEDEAIVGRDIQECLEGLGYHVTGVVDTGVEAIDRATKDKPSLVLMDIMLRGKVDGIEAARKIHEQNNIPIVYLTAYADDATFERAKVTEPYGYILKPFKQIELRTVIELAVYRHESEQIRRGQDVGKVVNFKRESAKPNSSFSFESKINSGLSISLTPEQAKFFNFLKSIPPLNELDPATLTTVANSCRLEHFKAGDFISNEGDEDRPAFIIMKGRAALVKSSTNGKDLIVEIVPAGDPFGLLTAIDVGPNPFSVKAQLETELLWISRDVAIGLLNNYPDLSRRLVELVLGRLRKAHDLSRTLAHDRVEVRVASALLALSPRHASANDSLSSYEIILSRQELAEMAGTAAETASRIANAMERDGIVDLSRPGKVGILDAKRLGELLEL
jgi:CRP-like cAMP-binding protein/DNA-binding response OmpR family regulator